MSGLEDDQLNTILEASRRCRYSKGSVIFHEGDSGDFLLILLSGRAKVVLQSERGQEVILAVMESPEVLGQLALLDGAPRSATVIALDSIEARKLAREHFLQLIAKNRKLLEGLLKDLARHLRATNEQVRTALMFDIHGQVLRALIKLGSDQDESVIIVKPRPSHQELAQMIGKARRDCHPSPGPAPGCWLRYCRKRRNPSDKAKTEAVLARLVGHFFQGTAHARPTGQLLSPFRPHGTVNLIGGGVVSRSSRSSALTTTLNDSRLGWFEAGS